MTTMRGRWLVKLLLPAALVLISFRAGAVGNLFMASSQPASSCLRLSDTVRWYDRVQHLDEVKVVTHRKRYSRKNNPAVELMRKVIASKRRNELSRHDYYSYNKYQKLTLATNDITTADLAEGIFSKIPDVFRQVEFCPYNNKLILPVMKTETVSRKVFRRQPHSEREIVEGDRADGINNAFRSGELLVAALKDFFTDVDIYDEQIRLLQHKFTSPVSRDAIGFYRFYIVDTLSVGDDMCVRLSFVPNNSQNFGFSGDIYIIDDSTFRVKRCDLTIPRRSDVNFIDNMRIVQEFERLDNGEWVLTTDDMMVELKLFDFLQKGVVIRNTRISGHTFDAIPDSVLAYRDVQKERRESKTRGDGFWQANRPLSLTPGEQRMDDFVRDIENMGGSRAVMTIARLLVENYIETGRRRMQSKFDVGPVLSTVSANSVDGLRTRIGGQTTALLHPNIFFSGYYARGWKSNRNYYKAEAVYSFNDKTYLPHEFPMRNIRFSSTCDIGTPTDKYLSSDKDNIFSSLKWATADKMMFRNSQQLTLEREEDCGLRTTVSLTTEKDEGCGALHFGTIRTTELKLGLRYAPGEKFVSTRQRRRMINLDAPVLTLSHATGLNGFLGGQYRYNITEASFFKRLWMKSWGKVDVNMRAGAQWNRVPYILLCMPASNVSYVMQSDMFSLMNSMEFLTDRYVSAHFSWDLNGKLLNRVPLVRRLKWREHIGVKAMWGTLTDKNNPASSYNSAPGATGNAAASMPFPDGSYAMHHDRPYIEVSAGVHNIFRCLHVEYVRRLTCLDHSEASRQGVRFKLSVKF